VIEFPSYQRDYQDDLYYPLLSEGLNGGKTEDNNIDARYVKDGLFYKFNNCQNGADHGDKLKKT